MTLDLNSASKKTSQITRFALNEFLNLSSPWKCTSGTLPLSYFSVFVIGINKSTTFL